MKNRPELLAPAGSPEALRAAVSAGADAVYFGVQGVKNARANAKNFTPDEAREAIALCHAHGMRVHVTLNTQVFDRELEDTLKNAEEIILSGADALIVADLGLAGLLHEYFPKTELHASTQCSGASVRDAEYLASLGFSRMVCARELPADDIRRLCADSPIEIEMFVHGALCVSASGQCLFSSIVGGRSGNRGECAQPCRLPYSGGYPLSPKDLCLAEHIKEIADAGVSSLKIEGRMKSPDYVYRTVSLYRRLIDEARRPGDGEIKALADSFSRSGFTDAYFTREVKRRPNLMLGVRTEADKERSRETSEAVPPPEKVKIVRVSAEVTAGKPSVLTLATEKRAVTVAGDVPERADARPLTAEELCTRLSKLGGTPFETTCETDFDIKTEGAFLPVSAINELRRRGVEALTSIKTMTRELPERPIPQREIFRTGEAVRTAEFLFPDRIGDAAREFFDTIYLPLASYDGSADGFVLPPVVFDSEEADVRRMAEAAVSRGAQACIISNAGQHKLVEGLPLTVTAGFRFNICNTESALAARSAGAARVTASPELSKRQIEGIAHHVPVSVIVYGRLPLMVTERCIIRAVSGDKCICGESPVYLTDRRGVRFPMYREYGCRNVICNSVPIYMADRKTELSELSAAAHHFIFTTESRSEAEDVVRMYAGSEPPTASVRRIK